jgi:hypothetical protein
MIELHSIRIDEEALADICRRYQVKELALFGSVLRQDFGKRSDIDVLVEFQPEAKIGFIAYLSLQEELEAMIGRKVDLVSKRGLKPLIREPVLAQARVLYAA